MSQLYILLFPRALSVPPLFFTTVLISPYFSHSFHIYSYSYLLNFFPLYRLSKKVFPLLQHSSTIYLRSSLSPSRERPLLRRAALLGCSSEDFEIRLLVTGKQSVT